MDDRFRPLAACHPTRFPGYRLAALNAIAAVGMLEY